MSCVGYGAGIDMWSGEKKEVRFIFLISIYSFFPLFNAVGCILAEMIGRKPLFPGRDYIHTLNLVCKVIGTPTAAEAATFPSEKARNYLATMPPQPRINLHQLFHEADPSAVDLLDKLLVFRYGRFFSFTSALSFKINK